MRILPAKTPRQVKKRGSVEILPFFLFLRNDRYKDLKNLVEVESPTDNPLFGLLHVQASGDPISLTPLD